jgi:CRISPR-associated exonuclease Cas4
MLYIFCAAILLFLLGLLLLWWGRRTQRQTGLPVGEVIYSDTGAWQQVEEALISRRYGLVGKPDYLVQVAEKGRTLTIPVEVKSRKRPPVLYENHILQLAAYCLLVEDKFKTPPPYGLLHYADATLKIPYTEQLREQVLATIDAICRSQTASDVKRSHAEAGRCRQCGYQRDCGNQALGPRSGKEIG